MCFPSNQLSELNNWNVEIYDSVKNNVKWYHHTFYVTFFSLLPSARMIKEKISMQLRHFRAITSESEY